MEGIREVKISLFGKHQSKDDCGPYPPLHAKISRWKYDEKQDICIVLKYLHNILNNFKEKNTNFTVEIPH